MAAMAPEVAAMVKRVNSFSNSKGNLERSSTSASTLRKSTKTGSPTGLHESLNADSASSLKMKQLKDEEEEDFAMRERLRQEFEHLCEENGMITTEMICEMMARQGEHHRSYHQVESTLTDLNKLAGMQHDGENLGAGLTLQAFEILMLSEDIQDQVGEEAANEIIQLREVFLEEEAQNLVQDVIHVSKTDLNRKMSNKERLETIIDPIICAVILVNAITVGVSSDVDWVGWDPLEVVFAMLFLLELLLKLGISGCRKHFFGHDWLWNAFDLFIVLFGVVDSAFILSGNAEKADLPGFSVIRMVRLGRLTRLVRLFRMFKELYLMVSGLFNGLRVLVWAMLLLFISVYVMGVLLTQTIGQDFEMDQALQTDVDAHKQQMFSTVPRSMFTVFRCLTAECIAPDGTPLTVHLTEEYGIFFVCFYFIMITVVTFGLFNLIMSTFVDHTLTAAKFNEQRIAAARKNEALRVARKLRELLRTFLHMDDEGHITDAQEGHRAATMVHDAAIDVTREQFEKACENREVVALMDDLDIHVENREDLFDVVDADGNGRVGIQELITGLMRVRGDARRSDVVAIRLAVRSLQRNVRELHEVTFAQQREMKQDIAEMKDQLAQVLHKLNTQSGCCEGACIVGESQI